MPKHPHGTELRYCHEGADHRAQVCDVHPDTGEVTGLAVYDGSGNIICGVRDPKPATSPQDRITHGHYWK